MRRNYHFVRQLFFGALFAVIATFSVHASNTYPMYSGNNSVNSFLMKATPIALEIQDEYHIPASVIISQAILESGYGKSEIAKEANNYFGIKAFSDWKGPKEYLETTDRGYRHVQPFRKYSSMEASFYDYAEFISGRARYKSAFDTSSGKSFVKVILRSGYCPDSFYYSEVTDIMDRYHLCRLDSL